MRRPKQPKVPRKPSKPTKPKERVIEHNSIDIGLYDGHEITLASIIEMLPTGISPEELFIRRDDNDYSCWECGGSSTNIDMYYEKEVDNKQYDKELLKYNTKMIKYQKKMEVYKSEMLIYEAEYKQYAEELKAYEEKETAKTIASLEKQLKKLKAS